MTSQTLDASLTLSAASALLSAGKTTSVELLEHVIDRLETTERYVRAYASLDIERAREEAEQADRTPQRGPLHGIPFGVKDVFGVAGEITACGSRALAHHRAHRDAAVVHTLRKAGAILVGKHVTHELTCGLDEPVTRNPYDPTRYAGGSSVGSAASVAAGSALFALGTDAAGSVRIPASATGTVGLKPTRRLLDTHGIVRAATAPSIDHVGIITRTVDDAAMVLGALAPGTADGHLDARVDGLRLGVIRVNDDTDVDTEVAALVGGALDELARNGALLVPIDMPELRDAPSAVSTVFATELAHGNRHLLLDHGAEYHPDVRQLIADGLATSAVDLQKARRIRATIGAALSAVMAGEELDALVSPTMPIPPPALFDLDPATNLPTIIARTCPFNLTGQPAISVPSGNTAAGLPVGLQIIGRANAEATVLRIARVCEAPLVLPPNPIWS